MIEEKDQEFCENAVNDIVMPFDRSKVKAKVTPVTLTCVAEMKAPIIDLNTDNIKRVMLVKRELLSPDVKEKSSLAVVKSKKYGDVYLE